MYKIYTKKIGMPLWYASKILLIMRLTTIILIATILEVHANGFSQSITLNKKNVPLNSVFKEITKQSGYEFFFNADLIRKAKPVTINIESATIDEALDKCLEDQAISYKIGNKIVSLKPKEKSIFDRVIETFSAINVRGRVVDEKGDPLAGATVNLKGTARSVITDNDGRFVMNNVTDDAILVITYLGFEPKEIKAASNLGNIQMTSTSGKLEEVTVSTGYQTLPKERATGSFETINNQLFNRVTSTDVISRLNVTVPSLFFNNRAAGPKSIDALTIRGLSSLTATQPLVVLDNMAYEGDINNINPNDVENITILKDAAAASIWGTRAGNGVIVITTKKGKYDKPLSISLNTNFTVSQKPDLKYIPQISSSDFIDVEKFLYSQHFYDGTLSTTDPYPPFITPVVSILSNPSLSEDQKNAQVDALRKYDVRDDYEKYVYRNQFNQQYALNLNGGGKQSNYLISGGFDKNLNNLKTSDFQRITLRSDYNFIPLKNLEIQTGFYFTQSKSGDIGGNSTIGYRTGLLGSIYPYARLADDAGTPLEPGGPYYNVDYLNTLNNNPNLLDWHYKPLEDMYKSQSNSKTEDILFNLGANYKINSIFSADLKYQYQTTNNYSEQIYDADSFYARDLINTYTDPSTFNRAIPIGGIYVPSHGRSHTQTVRAQLNANKTWNDKHQLAVIAGGEIRKDYSEANNEGFHYGYDPSTKTFKTVDYLSAELPLYYGGVGQIPYEASYGDSDNRFTSYFANASYTYNKRYILSASARKDASNVFGTVTNKRGNPLWSGGASWIISEEPFYNFPALPYLKIRATYGFSGNTITGTPAFALVTHDVNTTTQLSYTRPTNLPNPYLRWEKVGMLNFGLDFGSKNSRISGSLEYFSKKSTDVLADAPIDPTTSFSTQKFNTADLQGNGVDFSLHYINILEKSSFQWNTDFILSWNRNTVSRYLLKQTSVSPYISSSGINPVEGKLAYAVFAYPSAGLDPLTGDPRGYLNGQVSKDYSNIFKGTISDLKYFGSSVPLVFGSLRNSFSFKGISVSANILYKFDYYFRRTGLNYTNLFYGNYGDSEFADRWQKPGDENHTRVPSMVYPSDSNRDTFYNYSSDVVEKGDHIRLQDITAGYTFKSFYGFRNFKVYANASNLGIIWRANKKGIDPDILSGYPNPRTLAFGLSTNF